MVIAEEIAATGTQGIALALHNDVVAAYLTDLTTPEQRRRWLPGFVTGERLVAIAMSEPGAAPTSSRSRPPPAATAITTYSTGPRPSSATASSPTSSSWSPEPIQRPGTRE